MEKCNSNQLSLATASILGQPPSRKYNANTTSTSENMAILD